MATADSVKAKIQGLIDTSNATTGQSDTDLTSAINHLKEGYGQGGEADPLEGYFDGSLTEVNLPTITKIRDNAFRFGVVTDITMPNVTEIGAHSFANCYNLNLSKLPSGLEKIGMYAFAEAPITSLIFPSTLKEIGAGAFDMCMSLTSITFEETPTSLSLTAFSGCLNEKLVITVPWAMGEVEGESTRWGADNATIVYKNGEPLPPAEGDSRTWVFNDTITGAISANVNFTIGDLTECTKIELDDSEAWLTVWSPNGIVEGKMQYIIADGEWTDEKFKTITFTDDTYKDNATFYTWLQANATQQGSSGEDNTEPSTFTLVIKGTQGQSDVTYTAEEGMTWGEWVTRTEYNTGGWRVDSWNNVTDGTWYVSKDNSMNWVDAGDTILPDATYYQGFE